MSLNKTLKNWVAQSESWHAFKDFHLPEDDQARYPFLNQWDDCYISLLNRALEGLKSSELNEEQKLDLLSIGKGLVIYSLEGKREEFQGITFGDNMLYAAGMYYLADYPASALLLARKFTLNEYPHPIDRFISGFLSRKQITENQYGKLLHEFLKNGYKRWLRLLKREITIELTQSLDHNFETYTSSLLALALIRKFETDNIWNDLREQVNSRDHWKSFIANSLRYSVPVWSFFPSQKKALDTGILGTETVSLQMPTSAGKTAISELVIYNGWKENSGHKVLYLAPFRSLAAELNQGMGRNLKSLGISVKSIYGGHLPSTEERSAIQSVNLLISTPEKMLAVEDALPEILKEFDTIICDEGHLLDDENRGLSYELLLARLKTTGKETRRFLFMSAIIPNIEVINGWLGGSEQTVINSDYQPTQLEYAFLQKRGGYYDLYVNPLFEKPDHYILYRYLVPDSLKFQNEVGRIKSISTQMGISVATALRAVPSGAVALFTPEKRGPRGVESLAEEMIKQVNQHIQVESPLELADADYVEKLVEYFTEVFGEDYLLVRLVKIGALFHHGDLPQDIREVIEAALRKEKIRMVVCNTTLAEGVNLPIRTMVLHSTFRFDGKTNSLQQLSARDLKNLVGRAGRAGKETKGLIIVPHQKDREVINKLIRRERVDEVKGTLYRLISSITSVLGDDLDQLTNELLDAQDQEFLNWLDAVDVSLIDLLAEDIDLEQLEEIVLNMISETMSYYQSNNEEKQTQERLFQLRAKKISGYIANDTFKQLRKSGVSLRSFETINSIFDFDHTIWNDELDSPLEQEWMNYLLINGIFKSSDFEIALAEFNHYNKTELNAESILQVIQLWMNGAWFEEISRSLEMKMYQSIRLVNSFLGYALQTLVSSVIRIKIAREENLNPSSGIFNWPLYLQHGINTTLQLGLFELGLTDRVAVLNLSKYLERKSIVPVNEEAIKGYLLENEAEIKVEMKEQMSILAFDKFEHLLTSIKYR